jgi:phosphorylase kinase alpha/beta subunit
MNSIQQLRNALDRLRTPQGLWIAAEHFEPHNRYDYVWTRDVVQIIYAHLFVEDYGAVQRAAALLFELARKYQSQLEPGCDHHSTHGRFPIKFDWRHLNRVDPWNHLQNDALGAMLWLPQQCRAHGLELLDSEWKKELLVKIVRYLKHIEYWKNADAGYWEENNEVRASSVGICVAGLKAAKAVGIPVPAEMIEAGLNTLRHLLPNETPTRPYDAATLSLIWPYNVVDPQMARTIVDRVAGKLLRRNGVIRYPNDHYHGGPGRECEWVFLKIQLGICSKLTSYDGLMAKALDYGRALLHRHGALPEAFYGGTDHPNPNRNLAWSDAWAICAERIAHN